MLKVCLIKTTIGSMVEAEKLAASLVEKHLAACVHISGPGTSVYRWQDRLETEQELYLTIKTSPLLREAVVAYLADSHPYDLAEVIWSEFDATDGYGDWVYDECTGVTND